MSKIIYFYKFDTGEFCGSGKAPKNPRGTEGADDEFLLPANATFLMPRDHADPHVVNVFRGGSWMIVADFRGGIFWDTENQEKHEIKELGVAPSSLWTEIEPKDRESVWSGSAWELPLEVVRNRKIGEIRFCADSAANALKSNYSNAEFETWSRQEAGARLLQGDINSQGADAAFVRSLAAARGVSLESMVIKILQAVERAVVPGAEIIGKQQRLEDLILTAETKEQLEEIGWY